MQKLRIILFAVVLLLGAAMLWLHINKHGNQTDQPRTQVTENIQPAQNSAVISENENVFSPRISMQKWLYAENEKVYYQSGILYCRNPQNPDLQRLAIFVPQDFMQCIKNEDDTYSCAWTDQMPINKYGIFNAPFVIDAGDTFAEQQSAVKYSNVTTFTDKGIIYVAVGRRAGNKNVPAAAVDIKAAIRYLRANKGVIAGNVEHIFVFGRGEGATLSTIVGVSGDSALFAPYLEEIGALNNVSDAVYGVMAWSPISAYDVADAAYEWSMGVSRKDLSAGQQKLSQKLAKEYADFVNRAGFVDQKGDNLILQFSEDGYYQSGSYYDYVKQELEYALSGYLKTVKFPHSVVHYHDDNQGKAKRRDITGTYVTIDKYVAALNNPKPWVEVVSASKKSKIASIADFVIFFRPADKPVGAFDDINRQTSENQLFAGQNDQGRHFSKTMAKMLQNTPYAEEYNQDLRKTDEHGYTTEKLVDMFSPLYYLLPSKPGFRSAVVAPYWRIRSGAYKNDTALTEEINLALALKHYTGVKDVDFELVWESTRSNAELGGEPLPNFIAWIKEKAR